MHSARRHVAFNFSRIATDSSAGKNSATYRNTRKTMSSYSAPKSLMRQCRHGAAVRSRDYDLHGHGFSQICILIPEIPTGIQPCMRTGMVRLMLNHGDFTVVRQSTAPLRERPLRARTVSRPEPWLRSSPIMRKWRHCLYGGYEKS